MSAQPQLFQERQAEPDLIDRIAAALPEELRTDYYRELSHCRTLPESDEMLRILRAMQFLTLLIEQAPGQVAVERQQIAEVLARGIQSIQTTHQASILYQKQLEDRLAKLPDEIAKGINTEAIADKLRESLRQQIQETGLPVMGEALGVQAKLLRQTSKDLSAALDDFGNPKHGAVSRVHDALSWMKSDLKNAGDHVRVQMNGLGQELWRSVAVLCLGSLVLGFLIGIFYYRSMDAREQSSQQTVQPVSPTNHKERVPPTAPNQMR